MKHSFRLSCESTVDLPYSYVTGRELPVLFYSYCVDGVSYPDDMGRDPEALPRFYRFLAEGKFPSTSQLNQFQYYDFFESLLREGDLLHIALGSGMSSSISNAFTAAAELRRKYPERRIEVVDSLCSSSGYGMLVDYAADLRDSGASLEDTAAWLRSHRRRIHHQFFSTDLKYYRRSGRMSGTAAAVGAILNLCPILHLDADGRIVAYDKVRGTRNAIARTVDTMEQHAVGGAGYEGKCWICHSNCPAAAERLRAALLERFPNLDGGVRVCEIGAIIASHCGPGTLAVFFLGDERAR